MTYYQNVFTTDFRGTFPLADRSATPLWTCPGNSGRGDENVIAWAEGPYDLSGSDADSTSTADLNINLALSGGDYRKWISISVDITSAAASTSAVTALEINAALNADSVFTSYFTATLGKFDSGADRVIITQKLPVTRIRFYIVNGAAESVLLFNARAGVSELPTYFHRHIVYLGLTADEQAQFSQEAHNILLELDPEDAGGASNVDDDIISNAVDRFGNNLGFDPADVLEDWELMVNNQSGLYIFKKQTVDGSDRITEIIEYHAGAEVGDLGRKTTFTYTAANTNPDEIFEVPYVLESGDLITP
ncbi:MAG: hypothetical protein ACW99G_00420 [Candidatus Thorarchaeota archaeon]|jgi:hypothetical protein